MKLAEILSLFINDKKRKELIKQLDAPFEESAKLEATIRENLRRLGL
ncbi:N-6 DNA methylase [Arthrospira platensis C1]|nr:N-6 DNA methylase [Arthrospira platensis C1]